VSRARIDELRAADLASAIRSTGVYLTTGPFTVHVRSSIDDVAEQLARLYEPYPIVSTADFADFHVTVRRPSGLRRWVRPQVLFEFDGNRDQFRPLPLEQGVPLFEWGFNWAVAMLAYQFLVIHAAVVERNGRAAILPGAPGSGKSTLTAALVNNGWRLLSDELALLSLDGRHLTPVCRPISLKNDSIDIIRRAVPGAVLSRPFHETAKGTVALLRPPLDSIAQMAVEAAPRWVIFPRWRADAAADLVPLGKAAALVDIARNAYNYSVHGARGFAALAALMDRADCFSFTYGRLPDALSLFDELASR
jgi:HprK-related kinase A